MPFRSGLAHHHHHHREVLTDRCAPPWPLATSDFHIVSNGLASASWMWLSHVRRGRPEGLVQVVDGFLPSWLFTISWRAAFAGTLGSRRAMWPNRDWWRLSRMSLMSGRPDLWSTSALEICCHHWMSSICRWHFIFSAWRALNSHLLLLLLLLCQHQPLLPQEVSVNYIPLMSALCSQLKPSLVKVKYKRYL